MLLVGSVAELGNISPADLPVTESAPTRPISPYGVSKLAQTELGLAAARNGRAIVLLRLSNLLGAGVPSHLAPGRFATQLAALEASGSGRGALSTGSLEAVRDYIDVRDACRVAWQLSITQKPGAESSISVRAKVAMRDLVSRLVARSGLDVEIVDPERSRACSFT